MTDTIRAMLAALAGSDEAALEETFAADFYAFDGGSRFDGAGLAKLVKDAQDAGGIAVWTVNEPEVHVVGDWAWITYVNRGSFGNVTGAMPRTWLESAVLRRDGERWRLQFFHSSPARTLAPKSEQAAETP